MIKKQVGNDYNSRTIFISLLIILFCCVISYWPLSTGLFSLKNDIVVYFLPIRFQISEMINHCQFPFWTPYINLGHPLYTDMQSGVWNPIVWFFSLFGTYSMRTIQVELLLYIYLCGVNMFFLLKYFKLNWKVNLILSISFMLCGFISDTTQTLYWISGMAFLPLVFLYLLKLLNEKTYNASLLFSFSVYLLFSTAYPGEFIIIGYFLLSYFIVFIIHNKKETLRILKKMLLAVFIFLLLALPAIVAYLSGLDYISRGGGVNLDLALSNSMHPLSTLSYIFPLASWKLSLVDTDITARNSFIGLFPFFFLLIAFFTKTKSTFLTFLKWVLVISLILSLGKYGYLRGLTYYILPFTDTFRHPSMFRFITIFSGCILAAYKLEEIIKNQAIFNGIRKNYFIVLISLVSIISILLLFFSSASFNQLLPSSFSVNAIKKWFDNSTIKNWLIIELAIQVPFMIIIFRHFVKKVNLRIVFFAAITNSVIHTILFQPITVVGTETVSSFQTKINSFKREGFPLPDINKKVHSENNENKIDFSKYGPSYVYSKTIDYQYDFITPGPLSSHENFMKRQGLHSLIFNYPLLYRADTAILSTDSFSHPNTKRIILIEDPSLLKEINKNKRDTIYSGVIQKFNPNKWEIEVTSTEEGFYCLQQNYYPNWNLQVNGKKEALYLCNEGLIGFKLQAGKNLVTLEFKDEKILFLICVQIAFLLVFVIYILRKIWLLIRRNN